MFHFRAPHPVCMPNHRLETLLMNCPLDGEAYKGMALLLFPSHLLFKYFETFQTVSV
jgi:hypothetical protein